MSDRRGFEELVARAAIADEARTEGSKCPLSQEYTDKADIGLLSICLKYGLGAYEAAQRYPATAAKVFAVYGEDETFQKVLDRYGHPVIPVIAFFVEHGSREFQIRQAIGKAVQQMWEGSKTEMGGGRHHARTDRFDSDLSFDHTWQRNACRVRDRRRHSETKADDAARAYPSVVESEGILNV